MFTSYQMYFLDFPYHSLSFILSPEICHIRILSYIVGRAFPLHTDTLEKGNLSKESWSSFDPGNFLGKNPAGKDRHKKVCVLLWCH